MTVQVARSGAEASLFGEHYLLTLESLHLSLRPQRYFEIGVLYGDTLRLSRCSSVAIDPARNLSDAFLEDHPNCRFYEETSDEFFEQRNLLEILGGAVDLAFLDGLHRFEFLLRDFINTEKACHQTSILALHDCLPRDAAMTGEASETQASRYPGYWTGDVWKVVPILRRWRPDLEISVLDCLPTGLAVITNLNPSDRTLESRYAAIVETWKAQSLADYGLRRLVAESQVQSARAWRRQRGYRAAPRDAGRWRRALRRIARRPNA